jgi:hypothetical protein
MLLSTRCLRCPHALSEPARIRPIWPFAATGRACAGDILRDVDGGCFAYSSLMPGLGKHLRVHERAPKRHAVAVQQRAGCVVRNCSNLQPARGRSPAPRCVQRPAPSLSAGRLSQAASITSNSLSGGTLNDTFFQQLGTAADGTPNEVVWRMQRGTFRLLRGQFGRDADLLGGRGRHQARASR